MMSKIIAIVVVVVVSTIAGYYSVADRASTDYNDAFAGAAIAAVLSTGVLLVSAYVTVRCERRLARFGRQGWIGPIQILVWVLTAVFLAVYVVVMAALIGVGEALLSAGVGSEERLYGSSRMSIPVGMAAAAGIVYFTQLATAHLFIAPFARLLPRRGGMGGLDIRYTDDSSRSSLRRSTVISDISFPLTIMAAVQAVVTAYSVGGLVPLTIGLAIGVAMFLVVAIISRRESLAS